MFETIDVKSPSPDTLLFATVVDDDKAGDWDDNDDDDDEVESEIRVGTPRVYLDASTLSALEMVS